MPGSPLELIPPVPTPPLPPAFTQQTFLLAAPQALNSTSSFWGTFSSTGAGSLHWSSVPWWSSPPTLLLPSLGGCPWHGEAGKGCSGVKVFWAGSEGPAGITYGRKHAARSPRQRELRSLREGGDHNLKSFLGARLLLKGRAIPAASRTNICATGSKLPSTLFLKYSQGDKTLEI